MRLFSTGAKNRYCKRVIQRLQAMGAPDIWVTLVRECVELDETTERRVLGDALPPGLKLI
jgi:hypothetical protein